MSNQILYDLLSQLKNSSHVNVSVTNLDKKKAQYQLKRSKLLNRIIELISEILLLDELEDKK
jgi:hypothetical protein